MTRPRLQVVLAAEEDRTLLEFRTASSVPQRTKDRAEVATPEPSRMDDRADRRVF